jgi:DegV family protein with EDD domain
MPGIANARIRLVTDTTACLSSEFLKAHCIENVPQVILFGEESFLEEVEISRAEFIRRLRISPVLPKTAAPPPGEFVKAFARQLAAAETLLCLHPSTEVSGTVRSALTAREDAFALDDIRILDTRTVGGNLASMVIQAADWVEQGWSADDILARLQAMIPRGRTSIAEGASGALPLWRGVPCRSNRSCSFSTAGWKPWRKSARSSGRGRA